jgi:hypothetical protein
MLTTATQAAIVAVRVAQPATRQAPATPSAASTIPPHHVGSPASASDQRVTSAL